MHGIHANIFFGLGGNNQRGAGSNNLIGAQSPRLSRVPNSLSSNYVLYLTKKNHLYFIYFNDLSKLILELSENNYLY